MTVWYNEIDPYCVAWLRNLIAERLIPDGVVDDRPVEHVRPIELAEFSQCHFFAGLGGWARALRLVGWPDDRPVWTGSCPCQPFSLAGKRHGFTDQRHLWPFWLHHICQCRPAALFGEQVAHSADWQRLVFCDLEALDYAVGAQMLEAASVGANHKRDRFWFVAYPGSAVLRQQPGWGGWAGRPGPAFAGEHGTQRHVADGHGERQLQRAQQDGQSQQSGQQASRRHDVVGCGAVVADADAPGLSQRGQPQLLVQCATAERDRWWDVEPDVGRVADGIPARVAKLRALGNAVVPQAAAEFIKAALLDG